jgi:hypothetical protein
MDIEKIRGIILLISTLFNLFFAFFLWIKGKTKATFHLGWTAFFSAVYAFTYGGSFFFQVNKSFWIRASWLGVLILPAYLTFVYYFTERTKYLKLKSFLWYLGAVIISYLSLATPYIEKTVSTKYPYIGPETYGSLAPVGRIYIIICLAVSFFYLLKDYLKSQGFRKLQLKYFILGAGIYTVGGMFTAGTIPLFYPRFTYIDISVFLSVFWVGLTTYAILKKELFEIRIILTELLVGLFGILLFIQVFLSNSTLEYIWNTITFIIFIFFGYLFVKSILKEIRIKQKIGEASWKVLEQGEKVSENFKKVVAARENALKEWFLSDVNKELEINALKSRVKELEEKLKEKGEKSQ